MVYKVTTNVKRNKQKFNKTGKRGRKPKILQTNPKHKIKRRAKYKTTRKIRVLSKQFEQEIVYRLLVAIELGYHLTLFIIKAVIKLYFDRIGVDCQHFEGNMPTNEFLEQFLRRHRKVLGQKVNETCQYGQLYALDSSTLSKRVSAGTDLLEILDKCFYEILAEIQ